MSEKINLKVEKRTLLGKKVKQIRKQGSIPANIYGGKIKSLAIKVKENEFSTIFKKAGETNLIYLEIEGEKETRPTLISNLQRDPINRQILHVDFRQVDLTKKIIAHVEIILVGESPAEQTGAVIVKTKDMVEVEALPTDLPEKIEVNISKLLKIGDSILAKDLKVNDKIKILLDDEEMIVKVGEKQKEEVVEVPVETVAETPAEGAEGVTPKDGKVGEVKPDKPEAAAKKTEAK